MIPPMTDQEAETGPFGELGQQVSGRDLEHLGEFGTAPYVIEVAVHDLHYALSTSWWLRVRWRRTTVVAP